MRSLRALLIPFLLLLSGCGGCASVPKAFLEGEQAAFGAIAPFYEQYVTRDVTLSEDQRESRLRTIRSWKFALDRHAKATND